MKLTTFLIFLILLFRQLGAQNHSDPFKKKYVRIGIQNLSGSNLDHSLKPGDNMLKGNLGAGLGGVFEAGRHFYFIGKDKARLFNAGIDWTIISLALNPSGKAWDNYAEKVSGYSKDEFTSKVAVSLASKFGPMVSLNPVQDLVVDVRLQAAFSAYVLGPVYEAYENDDDAEYLNSFFPSKNDTEVTGVKGYMQVFQTSIRPDIGATVRWRAIGIALDYAPGNINMNYNRVDNKVETTGKAKVPVSSFQAKLSLSL